MRMRWCEFVSVRNAAKLALSFTKIATNLKTCYRFNFQVFIVQKRKRMELCVVLEIHG